MTSHPKTISCFDNAFLMPGRVSYKEDIANRYDEVLKKRMN
jgi:hypothetical protein